MKVLVYDTDTGDIRSELIVNEASFVDEANGYGEAVLSIRSGGFPESLHITVPWQHSVALATANDIVLWAGPIIRREGNPGSGVITLTARQWEGWLDRVYLTDVYDDDGEADAAEVVASRLVALQQTVESYPWALRPLLPTTPEALAGVTVPYSFRSTAGDGIFKGEPPSVLDDIRTVIQDGIQFAYVPHLTDGRVTFTLSVNTYALTPKVYLQVGYDIANLTLATDGGAQVTHWQVVGEDSALTATATASAGSVKLPLLMSTASFPTIAAQGPLEALAGALLAQTREPVGVARDAEAVGLKEVRGGDMVQIDIPIGTFRYLWTSNTSWEMRAASVEWHWSAGEGVSTHMTLVQPLDEGSVWGVPQSSLAEYLAGMDRRMRRIATRRAT